MEKVAYNRPPRPRVRQTRMNAHVRLIHLRTRGNADSRGHGLDVRAARALENLQLQLVLLAQASGERRPDSREVRLLGLNDRSRVW